MAEKFEYIIEGSAKMYVKQKEYENVFHCIKCVIIVLRPRQNWKKGLVIIIIIIYS